jgi:hypothetical protein
VPTCGDDHGQGVVLVVQEIGHGALERRDSHHPIGHAEELGEGPNVPGQVASRSDDPEFMGQGGGHIHGGFGGANDGNLHQFTRGVQAIVQERRAHDRVVTHVGHFHHLARHRHF